MAKKELSPEDLMKKQYSKLYELNQKMKLISAIYYISYSGVVYMQSLVPFVEKVIVPTDFDSISLFKGCLIKPNAFFAFGKQAKKSKLTISVTNTEITFGQNDNEELLFTIPKGWNGEDDKEYVENTIKPNFYKRFFHVFGESYVCYEEVVNGEAKFEPIADDHTEMIVKSKPYNLKFNGTTLTLTKHLMLDIKSGDELSLARLSYQPIENHQCRVFYQIKQITSIYTCYTLFNTLQS